MRFEMELLRDAEQYARWAAEAFDDYGGRAEARGPPDRYPCWAYTVVRSYAYEETEPRYLYAIDLREMLDELEKEQLRD